VASHEDRVIWISYQPQPSDLAGTLFHQELWYNFMTKRAPLKDFFPVNTFPGWPNDYSMYHISYPKSFSVPNLKGDVCSYFSQIGIDKPDFWWAN
jgi:hypothetical protein